MSQMYQCRCCGSPTPNSEDLGKLLGDTHYIIHLCDDCNRRYELEYEFQRQGETISEPQIICPWCSYEFDCVESGYYDSSEDEVECPVCGKHFDLEVLNRPRYSTKRSLCDMPENWQPDSE